MTATTQTAEPTTPTLSAQWNKLAAILREKGEHVGDKPRKVRANHIRDMEAVINSLEQKTDDTLASTDDSQIPTAPAPSPTTTDPAVAPKRPKATSKEAFQLIAAYAFAKDSGEDTAVIVERTLLRMPESIRAVAVRKAMAKDSSKGLHEALKTALAKVPSDAPARSLGGGKIGSRIKLYAGPDGKATPTAWLRCPEFKGGTVMDIERTMNDDGSMTIKMTPVA